MTVGDRMARSLHTQKLELRAVRRLARPYSKRREEAARAFGRTDRGAADAWLRPPVTTQRPQPGHAHYLAARDIESLLETLGPASLYGMRSIRLRSEPAVRTDGIL